jgi:hypothetical protein
MHHVASLTLFIKHTDENDTIRQLIYDVDQLVMRNRLVLRASEWLWRWSERQTGDVTEAKSQKDERETPLKWLDRERQLKGLRRVLNGGQWTTAVSTSTNPNVLLAT